MNSVVVWIMLGWAGGPFVIQDFPSQAQCEMTRTVVEQTYKNFKIDPQTRCVAMRKAIP